jgi:hypothetical protein
MCDHYVLPIWGMGVTTEKYGVLVRICPNWRFPVKPKSNTWILSENLKFFKTYKNSYVVPLCITDKNMRTTNKKYGVFVRFCRKLMIFGKTVG